MKIETNKITTNYETTDQFEGDTVVLSHSLGSSLIMWDPQIDEFSKNFQILRYDTRGHGNSSAPSGSYTMELLVDDAVALLDALKIEKAHWVGLSMGGMIGQGLALKSPERLKSLTLCNTMSVIREEMKEVWKNRIKTGERFGMHHLVDFTMERWFTESYREMGTEEYQRIHTQFLETSVYGYVGCCHAIYNLNYVEQLNQISVPTHIIAGDQDLATPVAESRVMHDQIAGSSLTVIEGAAHLSNVEKTEAFNASLAKFLQSQ